MRIAAMDNLFRNLGKVRRTSVPQRVRALALPTRRLEAVVQRPGSSAAMPSIGVRVQRAVRLWRDGTVSRCADCAFSFERNSCMAEPGMPSARALGSADGHARLGLATAGADLRGQCCAPERAFDKAARKDGWRPSTHPPATSFCLGSTRHLATWSACS